MCTVGGSSMMWFLSRFNISRELMSKRDGGIVSSRLSNSNSSVTRERLSEREREREELVNVYSKHWEHVFAFLYRPMESGSAMSWLASSFRRVRLVRLPRSVGNSWRLFSERWRSEREANFANPSGRCSSLFLVTSNTVRLNSLIMDWSKEMEEGRS